MAKKSDPPDRTSQAWSEHVTLLLEEMQQRQFVAYRTTGTWQPATNVYESDSQYLICVDLAGIAEDAITVNYREPARIVIRGKRSQPRPAAPGTNLSIHVMEIDEGPFFREIDLPQPIDAAAIGVRYERGFLWLTLPIRKN